ncbi:MAG TPA: hypothetical protein VLE53_10985 [Gemmatimonadaceae bacterium]|nr:hypothetical protein [Gemmatimonadaceae bacterium]
MRFPSRADTLGFVRAVLLAALVLGLIGTLTELFLLEHTEDVWQWAPIVLMAVTLLVLAWFGLSRAPASLRTVQWLMGLFLISGLLGVWLHYKGNVEFELEMYPDLSGLTLFRDAMMGATPSLAPGTMIQLGMIGLAWAFRHPAGRTVASSEP